MIRNQLVVGLSDVVIVVQAGEKSGTVNTGEVALKAGVPLWVMSNCNFDSSAEGNKYLLDKGATKIDSIEEIEYKFKEIEAKSNGIGEKKSNNNQVSLPI
jgi:DNA processing protein